MGCRWLATLNVAVVTRGDPEFKALATVLAKAGQWAAGFQVSIDPKRPGRFRR